MDTNVSIDNLDCSHTVYGSNTTKHRTSIVTQVQEQTGRIELRPCSSFQGNGPPNHQEEHYGRLVYSQTSSVTVNKSEQRLIHYTGNDLLTARTYLRLGESHWTGLSNTPASVEGYLIDDEELEVLRDLIGLGEDHPLVERVRQLRAEQEHRQD